MRMLICSHPDLEKAKKLARQALTLKKAACVQILENCFSVYEWENQIEENKEILLFFKTLEKYEEELFLFIQQNHPYQTPEIISFSVDKVLPDYLNWMNNVLEKGKK